MAAAVAALAVWGCGEGLAPIEAWPVPDEGLGGSLADLGAAIDMASAPEVPALDMPADASADGAASEDMGDGLLGPPYPVVLAHGMFGFDKLAGLEAVPYWYGLEEAFEEAGEVVVVTEVSPLDDSRVRGAQLLAQVQELLERSGYRKVNIIGHSQGGLDARWVAHRAPELVASVVTVSTPHRGTLAADIVLELVESSLLRRVADAIVRLLGRALYDELGKRSSIWAPLELFSTPGIAAFNEEVVDRGGVYYASVAGRSDGHLAPWACEAPGAPPFIEAWRDVADPVDPLLNLTAAVLAAGDDVPSDGLVRVEDAKWGEFLGCVPADHMDEVGHLLGDSPGRGNGWDHVSFYRELVAYLRARGL